VDSQNKTQLNGLIAVIEQNWRPLDTLFDDLAAMGDFTGVNPLATEPTPIMSSYSSRILEQSVILEGIANSTLQL